MTDQTSNGFAGERRTPTIEYRLYFGIIFLISLPWAFASWILGLSAPDGESKGFIGRAWKQASVITPQIFSA